jgi:hypothetical protein
MELVPRLSIGLPHGGENRNARGDGFREARQQPRPFRFRPSKLVEDDQLDTRLDSVSHTMGDVGEPARVKLAALRIAAAILCDAGGLSSADVDHVEPHATRIIAALSLLQNATDPQSPLAQVGGNLGKQSIDIEPGVIVNGGKPRDGIDWHLSTLFVWSNDRIGDILDYLLRALDRHGMHKQTGPTARPAPD